MVSTTLIEKSLADYLQYTKQVPPALPAVEVGENKNRG